MTIRSLFTISAFVLGTAAAVSAVTLIAFVNRSREIRHEILESLHISSMAHQIETALLSHQRDNYFYKITGQKKYLDRRSEARDSLKKTLTELFSIHGNSGNPFLETVGSTVANYFSEFESLRYEKGTPYRIFSELSEPAAGVRKEIKQLLRYNQDQVGRYRAELAKAESAATRVGYLFAGLLPFAVVTLLMQWRSRIVFPLEKISAAIENFRTGKKLEIFTGPGVAEIGKVADAFRDFITLLDFDRKNRERFLRAVAHDLKNPLGAVQMATEILLSDDRMSAKQRTETILLIRRQTAALFRLIEDIGLAAAANLEDLKIDAKPCDVRSLLTDMAALYADTSPIHHFEVELPERGAHCFLDSDRLNQALHNLISNAIKYSPRGGTVKIGVRAAEGMVRIFVRDSGLGIEKGDLYRIFEPFQRAGKENSPIKGLGIGLATTKKIVELMNGQIEVESELGTGSVFVLIFPEFTGPSLTGGGLGGEIDRDFASRFTGLDL